MKYWLAMAAYKLRYLLLLVAAAPSACHYKYSMPALWKHGSSSALEWIVTLWVICLVIIFISCLFISNIRCPDGRDYGKYE